MADAGRITTCREVITSERYAEFLIERPGTPAELEEELGASCVQRIDQKYVIASYEITNVEDVIRYRYIYSSFPKVYALMDTSNMESAGIQRIRRQSFLNLLGKGVLIGFIDTGIDYQNKLFQNEDQTTRILSIWDQTIQTGNVPDGFLYGSEYTKEDINNALQSENPLEVVPSIDTNGHGTFMAGIAAGNIDEANDFTGAAPESEIIMVKLKECKQVFREYYFISPQAVCYQETDLIMGVKYLLQTARKADRPLIICIGMGTNAGGHDGKGVLDDYLCFASDQYRTCIITPAGNEANYGLHYRGFIRPNMETEDVEIRVGEQENGFALELWVRAPSVLAVGFVSPSGELVQKIPSRVNSNQAVTFLFEPTRIFVSYRIVEFRTGDELIFMRFDNPTKGIWKIRVYVEENFENPYDIWLPVREFLSSNTEFSKPDPDITITDPGNAERLITIAAYNHTSNAIYTNSGRGNTRSGRIKPDIAAPGVNIYGPIPGDIFTIRSGTSIAAAHAAGAAALLMEWAITRANNANFDTSDIKALFIKGAKRGSGTYPNREYGYGTLDVFGAFESLRTTLR